MTNHSRDEDNENDISAEVEEWLMEDQAEEQQFREWDLQFEQYLDLNMLNNGIFLRELGVDIVLPNSLEELESILHECNELRFNAGNFLVSPPANVGKREIEIAENALSKSEEAISTLNYFYIYNLLCFSIESEGQISNALKIEVQDFVVNVILSGLPNNTIEAFVSAIESRFNREYCFENPSDFLSLLESRQNEKQKLEHLQNFTSLGADVIMAWISLNFDPHLHNHEQWDYFLGNCLRVVVQLVSGLPKETIESSIQVVEKDCDILGVNEQQKNNLLNIFRHNLRR